MLRLVLPLLLPLLLLALGTPLAAETVLSRGVAANGGGEACGTHHTIAGTIGQACIGIAIGPGTIHEVGFWYPIPSQPMSAEDPDRSLPAHFGLWLAGLVPVGQPALVHYALPVRGPVTIRVYDITGRQVRQVVKGVSPPGHHQVSLATGELPSGIYFCRMTADGFTQTRRIALLR